MLQGPRSLATRAMIAAMTFLATYPLLGGSWVAIRGVISLLSRVRSTVILLISPLITTHEPPSTYST